MKVDTTTYQIKCSLAGCKNVANFAIRLNEDVPYNQLYLCKDCLDKLNCEYKKLKTKIAKTKLGL